VVTGIGFLGAGIIFRTNNRVNGITTAASIWLSAALGVGIGGGYYMVSIMGGFLVVSILFVFSFFDSFLDKMSQVREYKIVYPYEENQQHKYEKAIEKYGLAIKSRTQSKTGNMITGIWTAKGNEVKHHQFIEYILQDEQVADFSF
jgi:putative Mg2+ transporter-C (MgtC) family protein